MLIQGASTLEPLNSSKLLLNQSMNGPQSRPPVTGPESGVTNEIPRRGKSRTGKASASNKQNNMQMLKQEFAVRNGSQKQLKRNCARKAPKSRKKT